MLATSMMNACWLLNPEALVIGGGVARAGDLIFNPFREHLMKQLSGPFKDGLAILPAAFGHEAGTIGAAALALDEMHQKGTAV
jgi:glucokinase